MTRLSSALPSVDENLADLDIESQARAVLRYVVHQVLYGSPREVNLVALETGKCPNCGVGAICKRSPYCGDECRETASFVRQFRSGLSEGSIFEPDRQVAFGQNLWYMVGGGRPLRRALIPPKDWAKVLDRQGGKCATCEGIATTIDHIDTACNRTINLIGVCDPCSKTKPFAEATVVNTELFQRKISEIAARVGAVEPMRPCDQAETWDWRAYLRG